MNKAEEITLAYAESSTYPDLVKRLITIGILSYSVDVSTGIILYRLAKGENLVQRGHLHNRTVAGHFNRELTVQAIRENQQGKTTYAQFMEGIARAGVRFYEATFEGNKRVTYIGAEGEYEEEIPVFFEQLILN